VTRNTHARERKDKKKLVLASWTHGVNVWTSANVPLSLSDMLTACPRRSIFDDILSTRCFFLSFSLSFRISFFHLFSFSFSPFPFSSRPSASRCWTDNRFDDEQGNFRSPSHSRPAVSDATIILSIPSIRARTIFSTNYLNISGDSRGEESQSAGGGPARLLTSADCLDVG